MQFLLKPVHYSYSFNKATQILAFLEEATAMSFNHHAKLERKPLCLKAIIMPRWSVDNYLSSEMVAIMTTRLIRQGTRSRKEMAHTDTRAQTVIS